VSVSLFGAGGVSAAVASLSVPVRVTVGEGARLRVRFRDGPKDRVRVSFQGSP
jgi:hypothetical protein